MLITEIAKEANVSPATVSRALNWPEIVAPATLARIRSVMEKHNYVPAPPSRRRGPKMSRNQETLTFAERGTLRTRAHSLELFELVVKSVDLFRLVSTHQAKGGALIFRYPDGREERPLLL
jgi:hypothetical protein